MASNESTQTLNDLFQKHFGLEVREILVDEIFLLKLIKENVGEYFNLKDYIKRTFFVDRELAIIADLSYQNFNGLELQNINFNGCILTGAIFKECSFTNVVMRDLDLSYVKFIDCNFTNVDLRGVHFNKCSFVYNNEVLQNISGIKLSSSEYFLQKYIKDEELARQQQVAALAKKTSGELDKLDLQIKELKAKLSFVESFLYLLGRKSGNKEFDLLIQERYSFVNNSMKLTDNFLPSQALEVLITSRPFFDYGYSFDLDESEKTKKNQYVRITKDQIEDYLLKIKESPGLSLIQYASSVILREGNGQNENSRIVPDLSSYRGLDGELVVTDLSNMDFTGADLREACFLGTKLSGSNFTKANISKSVFEYAELDGTLFNESIAHGVNFIAASFKACQINNSEFNRSIFNKANFSETKLEATSFDYVIAKNLKGDISKIINCNFNFADLESVCFQSAEIDKTSFYRSNLKESDFCNARISETNFEYACLEAANCSNNQISDTNFSGIYAAKINFRETHFIGEVKFESAFMINSQFMKINAEQINLRNSVLNNSDFSEAKCLALVLDSAMAIASNFSSCTFEKFSAKGTNLTKANLTKANLAKSNFTRAIFTEVQANKAELEGGIFTKADMRVSSFFGANMSRIDATYSKLNGAILSEAELSHADVEAAEIDNATELTGSKIDKMKGLFRLTTDHNRAIQPIYFKEKCDLIFEAKTQSIVGKIDSFIFKQIHNFFNFTAECFRQPLSQFNTTLLVGTVLAYIFTEVISNYLNVKANFVDFGIVSLAALFGYFIGFLTIKYIKNSINGTNLILSALGAIFGSYPGIVLGFLTGISLNRITKDYFRSSINEKIEISAYKIASFAIEISDGVRSTQEAKEFYKLRKADRRLYKSAILNKVNDISIIARLNLAEIFYARALSREENDTKISIDNNILNIQAKKEKVFDNELSIGEKNNINAAKEVAAKTGAKNKIASI